MALPGPRLSSSPSPPASPRPPPGPRQTDRHPACPWSYPPRTSHPTASQLLEILMVLYHPNLLVNAPISTTKGKCESFLDTGRLLIRTLTLLPRRAPAFHSGVHTTQSPCHPCFSFLSQQCLAQGCTPGRPEPMRPN